MGLTTKFIRRISVGVGAKNFGICDGNLQLLFGLINVGNRYTINCRVKNSKISNVQ